MEYKAKAVAGLLAATCVFSIIALILSVVNVKDVFLPPRSKVGSLGGAWMPTLTWVLAAPWTYPRFQAGCACHRDGDKPACQLECWVGGQGLGTVTGPAAHAAFSSQSIASSKGL